MHEIHIQIRYSIIMHIILSPLCHHLFLIPFQEYESELNDYLIEVHNNMHNSFMYKVEKLICIYNNV